jgi:hypothetical protein
MGRVHRRDDVDVDRLAPACLVVLGAERADIGDEMVDAAVAGEVVDPFLQCRVVCNVERTAFNAVLLGSPVRLALLDELGVARAEADERAFGQKGIDDGAADALGAAGDQHALALETEIHDSPDGDARL